MARVTAGRLRAIPPRSPESVSGASGPSWSTGSRSRTGAGLDPHARSPPGWTDDRSEHRMRYERREVHRIHPAAESTRFQLSRPPCASSRSASNSTVIVMDYKISTLTDWNCDSGAVATSAIRRHVRAVAADGVGVPALRLAASRVVKRVAARLIRAQPDAVELTLLHECLEIRDQRTNHSVDNARRVRWWYRRPVRNARSSARQTRCR